MKRSTSWLVCSVVAVHGFAICLVLLIQGCGTPISPSTTETTMKAPMAVPRPMPPRATEQRPVVRPRPNVRAYVPPVHVPSEDSTSYTVQKGESLSRIASRFNVTVTELQALNQIKKPNMIQVGQRLKLPGRVDTSTPRPVVRSEDKPGPKVAVSGDKYIVKPGDTLSQIALDHGVKVADIRGANTITKDVIFVGQSLVIPGATKTLAKSTSVAEQPAAVQKQPDPPVVSADSPPPASPIPVVPAQSSNSDTDPDTGAGAPSTTNIPLTMHTHEVKDGEDLYSVSLIWDVSIDELKRINGLSGTELTRGQVLRIPRVE